MGSFSWNRADKLGKYENIYGGCAFKSLIPKEFGGGFIRDHYQDYGDLGPHADEHSCAKYDIHEILAFWNHEAVKPMSTNSTRQEKEFKVGAEVTLNLGSDESKWLPEIWKENGRKFIITHELRPMYKFEKRKFLISAPLDNIPFEENCFDRETKYIPHPAQGLLYDGDVMPMMPEHSRYTSHNRTLGIYLYNEEVEAAKKRLEAEGVLDYWKRPETHREFYMKYPPKLVSVGFQGTYEDCEGYSVSDPDQGFHPRERRVDPPIHKPR